MPKHILVKPIYRQIFLHWEIIFGIFLVLSACGDLVKESDTGACNSAIDARNYNEALSVCTSRKDKASAYMGKAGYDIVNLLKASGSAPGPHTAPSGVSLGLDDPTPASILNILQLSVANIADDDTRAAAISSSKSNLDSASELLHKYLNDNSSPLTTDEILLNTFAISFAMQLNQLEIYDNATTSKETWPVGDNVTDLKCDPVENVGAASSVLIAMDGHLWAAERDGMSCAHILGAIKGISDADEQAVAFTNFDAWVDNDSFGALPEPFDTSVCGPISSLTEYLSKLTLNIAKLSLSGGNTKVITDADNSTNKLMKAVGCKE